MTDPDHSDLSALWGQPLQPTHCPSCNTAHLIPVKMKTAYCPSCYRSRLEPQPSVIREEPPELILEFRVKPLQIRENINKWLKGVWLRPRELNGDLLSQRLTRTYIPLWLIDGTVTGSWKSQMGYDYQVASSQEIFRNGNWMTRKLTETRVRWEPRAGTIEQTYQNIMVPALEQYTQLVEGLGNYDTKNVTEYSPSALEGVSVRVPDLLPDSAWPIGKFVFNRLAAKDCQIASGAQHVEEYILKADYVDQNWTQLLLPLYTTAYRDEDGETYPILINGQNGKIFGIKRASISQARYWSVGLIVTALVFFGLGLLFAAGTIILPPLGVISFVVFIFALILGIISPIPAYWAWKFNRSQDEL